MKNLQKKETRIMKVTMDADEFEKFDKGITVFVLIAVT